ncbi:proteasome assembly chaperone family protein [Sinomonas susongensis]|uniref:proteasome assembly chaperone family protein n=1 Tax=Sinomonas susongensis TaxID=1324851 RepID=UPI0011089BB3|nr:PAC2 family protein [Sinomonas susongensis]
MNEFDADAPAPHPGLFPTPEDGERVTVMLAAFEGWNDAGEAATEAIRAIKRQFGAQKVGAIDADDYYDFQFTRPTVRRSGSGRRRIRWPSTRVSTARLEGFPINLVFVQGTEPSYRWRGFTEELMEYVEDLDVDYLIVVGALLADVPHSRPIPVTATSEAGDLRERLNLEASQYEGPTGIVGVFADAADHHGIPTVSLWAAVPHYVAQAPSPKAQLALMHRIEELIQVPLETNELAEDAEAWERGVNELATEDPEIAAYIQQLEEAKDTADLPEATGESIAREFERYLKRRGKDGGASN